MFYGEYPHSLDKKGRLVLPSCFREIFAEQYVEKIFVTRGLDRCLFVFTEEVWKAQEKKFKEMSFTRGEARKFNRLYFSGAVASACDKQGRILIPQFLKEYAEIKTEVMIVGVSDRIEIWARNRWEEFYKSSLGSFEELAEKLLEKTEGS